MRSALLALTPNSNPSAEDHKAKELAQQINFKVQTLALDGSRLMHSPVSDVTPRRSKRDADGTSYKAVPAAFWPVLSQHVEKAGLLSL